MCVAASQKDLGVVDVTVDPHCLLIKTNSGKTIKRLKTRYIEDGCCKPANPISWLATPGFLDVGSALSFGRVGGFSKLEGYFKELRTLSGE